MTKESKPQYILTHPIITTDHKDVCLSMEAVRVSGLSKKEIYLTGVKVILDKYPKEVTNEKIN